MLYIEKKPKELGIFLIYTHKDKKIADWLIQELNNNSSIKYRIIRDVEELKPGVDFIEKLEDFYKNSYAAIALITKSIFKKCKSWVFYEMGFFKGQDKFIIPYIPKDNPYISEDLIPKPEDLPEFLSRFHVANSVDKVIDALENLNPITQFYKKLSELQINPNDIDLDYHLTFELNIPKVNNIPIKDFNIGVQIIRFGHPDWVRAGEERYTSELKRLQITLNVFKNWETDIPYDIPDWYKVSSSSPLSDTQLYTTYKISFPIPIHKRYGITFKIFIDLNGFYLSDRNKFINDFKEYNKNLIDDVSISTSRFYNHRIYILLKEIEPIKIVDEVADNIKNNFIYPV